MKQQQRASFIGARCYRSAISVQPDMSHTTINPPPPPPVISDLNELRNRDIPDEP